jgi:hypothetical protein
VSGNVNPKTQVQKTEPGAPSASVQTMSERSLLTRATCLVRHFHVWPAVRFLAYRRAIWVKAG